MGRASGSSAAVAMQRPQRHGAALKAPARVARRRRAGRTPERVIRLKTAKGVPVELRFYRDVDTGAKPAWQTDLIEARTKHGPAGYLLIAYIPAARAESFFPSAVHYAVREEGVYSALLPLLDKPDTEWSRDETLSAIQASADWPYTDYQQLAGATDDEVRAFWTGRKHRIEERYGTHRAEMLEALVDKPYVDHIRVYSNAETPFYDNGERVGLTQTQALPSSACDQRRLGIGTVCYEAGAVWCHKNGFVLGGSSIQSPKAKKVWRSLGRQKIAHRGVSVYAGPLPGSFRLANLSSPGSSAGGTRTTWSLDAEAVLLQRPELAALLD